MDFFRRVFEATKNKVSFNLIAWFPYSWLILFFLIPVLMILGISFSEGVIAIPPYKPLFLWTDQNLLEIKISFSNYLFVLSDHLYLSAYLSSLTIAFLTTIICLIIAYPMAYGIARASQKWKTTLLMLIILPFWTSFLVRVYAWIGLLNEQGAINSFLLYTGIIEKPLELMNNLFGVSVGIVYAYLPFMVIPLYTSLEKIDFLLLEAAFDLGCRPTRAFWRILVPLSFRGALGGAMLVFIPAVGEFVIPELLGGAKILMIGKVLWNEFFYNRDWPLASALAILMLLLLLGPMILFQKIQNRLPENS